MFHRYSRAIHRTAASAFEDELPEFFQQCEPLARPLLEFLENDFNLKIGHVDLELPLDTFEKSPAQTHIREAIIPLLMKDFERKGCEFDHVKDYDIFAVVFHWFVSYHRSTTAKKGTLKRTRLAKDIIPGDSDFGARVFQQSHQLARTFAYDPTGCQPKCPSLDSRFEAGSFYGERIVSTEEEDL